MLRVQEDASNECGPQETPGQEKKSVCTLHPNFPGGSLTLTSRVILKYKGLFQRAT